MHGRGQESIVLEHTMNPHDSQPSRQKTASVTTAPAVEKKALSINRDWEVHPEDVRRLMKEKAEFLLLDIRLEKEVRAAKIPGATCIPMHELPHSMAQLEAWRHKPVVVHCHHGARSLQATVWLREQGFTKTHSMAGGIHAWSLLVDSSVPRY